MTILNVVFGLFAVGVLILAAYARAKRRRLPVTFTSLDEMNAVAEVVITARRQISADDPRRTAIWLLWMYLPNSRVVPLTRISAQDLEILAPFIDQFIAGKGPPSILPAEYEDWRPAVLSSFKARMQDEGLWPHTSDGVNLDQPENMISSSGDRQR